jgi:membrane fusion protein, copper/silver efflux system
LVNEWDPAHCDRPRAGIVSFRDDIDPGRSIMPDERNKNELPNTAAFAPQDEGGLRAPPGLTGWRKAWWWFDFIILVKLARLRFIAILVAIGVVITQWDALVARYEKWTRPTSEQAAASTDTEWFCPMHPTIIRDNPREKCPICFMPLSKRRKGDLMEEALPAGIVNRVQLSPYRIVLAGVGTSRVEYVRLSKHIHTVGYVEFNERSLKTVSARVKGRIDSLLVNETGQMVESDDVLASLYSPELNVSMQNLLDAHKRKNADLVASGRQRLRLLGIGDDQIDEALNSGQVNTHLKIRTPIAGHVIKKYVREGQYVDEGMPLYDIVDLSTVWIQAQVYEEDLAFLPADQSHKSPRRVRGLPVTATTRAYPGEEFEGTLAFIYPHVDQETRTVTVRYELDNPGHKLRPGTTATVTIKVPPHEVPLFIDATADDPLKIAALNSGRMLAIPESAVIDTGSQSIAYRQSLPGVYDGVQLVLGPRMAGPDEVAYFPVLTGLSEGDLVVTAGSFLVDAETRLNPAAGSIYFGGSGGSKSPSGGSTVRPSTPEDTDAKIQGALARLSPSDRTAALQQKLCPVLPGSRLGSMGVPVKLTIEGQTVFLCCAGCREAGLSNPQETLRKVGELKAGNKPGSRTPAENRDSAANQAVEVEGRIAAALAKLVPEDRRQAEEQKFCAVLRRSRLGSMGAPIKLMIEGRPVFLCCEGCRDKALENPSTTLNAVDSLTGDSTPGERTSP